MAIMPCCALLLLLRAVPLGAVSGSAFDDLLADLAGRIVAAIAPADTVHLVTTGSPPTESYASDRLGRDLAQRLAARGVRIVDSAVPAAVVRVSCSTNLRERVCAADIKRGDQFQTVIASSLLDRTIDSDDAQPLTLDLRHVIGQSAPILDVALAGDRLIVLDPTALTLYERVGTRWVRRRSQPIASSRVWPRDVRGRLRVSGGFVEAFLPGVVCRATLEGFTSSCADERQPWPLAIHNAGIASGRNYFTTPEGLAFFGFAALDTDAGARWLLAADRSRLLLADET